MAKKTPRQASKSNKPKRKTKRATTVREIPETLRDDLQERIEADEDIQFAVEAMGRSMRLEERRIRRILAPSAYHGYPS
jgi:hypothetical protein